MSDKTCEALDTWAALMKGADGDRNKGEFGPAWDVVRRFVRKSCLLDRVINHGEAVSQTPCPVHLGIWSGCHHGWPGSRWSDGTPIPEDPMLRAWHDAGCRCYKHGCGCTTGWQPGQS